MSFSWSKLGMCCARPINRVATNRSLSYTITPRRMKMSLCKSFQVSHFSTIPPVTPAFEESSQGMIELRKARILKIDKMSKQGVNSYAYNYKITTNAAALHEKYLTLENGCEDISSPVGVAGRVMVRRFFGKLAFFELQDQTGSIQLYIDKTVLGDEFKNMKDWIDSGDIIGITGTLKRTEKGELSIFVTTWIMLTKALYPLPDKFHGLTDIKKRYAHRSEDMIVNPEVRRTLFLRSVIIRSIRSLLDGMNYLEAETPVLQTHPGGADAKPFLTYHNSLEMKLTLRIATELHLKRLVVGGFDRVYEIGRIFRNEGLSSRHNPEFTSIELYQAYADYEDMMTLTEEMISTAVQAVCAVPNHQPFDVSRPLVMKYQDTELDFSKPYRRVAMHDIVEEVSGICFDDFLAQSDGLSRAIEAAVAAGVPRTKQLQTTKSVLEVMNITFEELCEKTLIQPTFVIDHPIETSPLAKSHRTKTGYAERFELYIYGREIANAFSELTDPVEQRRRLEEQIRSNVNESESVAMDEDFLHALEIGMPPTVRDEDDEDEEDEEDDVVDV